MILYCCLISPKDGGLKAEHFGGDLSGIENGLMFINGKFKRQVFI